MIIVSSGVGLAPIAGFTIYSATKAFDHFVACGLGVEFEGKIDVMSYTPGMVDTKLIPDEEMKKNKFLCIPSELSAQTSLRDLGN